MFPAPAPSAGRGDIVLQPNYFTSSVYVKALRDDISTLILRYHEAYSQAASVKPFALFKTVWLSMGWNWLHFKVFDNRSRQAFLDVTVRLFIERTVKTEAPFTRTVAIFAAYTFFNTQVKDPIPDLHSISSIPIPYHYLSLTSMAQSLTTPYLLPLRPHVHYVISCLQKDRVFLILPKSELGPMNPRDLPREIYASEGTAFSTEKRKGRPAKREKGKKARLALEELDAWVSQSSPNETSEDLEEYRSVKSSMMQVLEAEESLSALGEVNQTVLARLKETQEDSLSPLATSKGILRVEQAIMDEQRGVFGLLR